MPNKLTDAQRASEDCPDCGSDPLDKTMHMATCRRVAMGISADVPPEVRALDLQCGPPWKDWPDDVEPVNPLAKP